MNLVNIAYAGNDINQLVLKINKFVVNPFIALLFAIALAYFLFGLVVFLANTDNEEKRKEGKQQILWGIIGMFIMIAVFGIMQIIIGTFGIEGVDPKSGSVDLS